MAGDVWMLEALWASTLGLDHEERFNFDGFFGLNDEETTHVNNFRRVGGAEFCDILGVFLGLYAEEVNHRA